MSQEPLTEREQQCIEHLRRAQELEVSLAEYARSKSTLGKALAYTAGQWSKLTRFLEHGEVPAHNNRVENDIRPFAVGRRAWLFIDTQRGARASANLYSLAQTCRANGINAHAYFTCLYKCLPLAFTAADLEILLPWNAKPLLSTSSSGP